MLGHYGIMAIDVAHYYPVGHALRKTTSVIACFESSGN